MLQTEPFPLLDESGLAALALLSVPVHIYCFDEARICWANSAALEMWQAASIEELQQRRVGPDSTATSRRLAEYREAFSRGERRTEVWTLYPRGIPVVMHSECQGIRVAGHAAAMLAQSTPLAPASLSAVDLRALEAVRHCELMITLFSGSGEVLMRNPAAAAYFKGHDDQAAPETDLFRTMFANVRDADALLARLETDDQATGAFILSLTGLPLHRLQVRRTVDPVTGATALLVLQEDVSLNQLICQKLEESEDAFHAILELTASAVIVPSAHTGAILYANTAAMRLFGPGLPERGPVQGLFVAENVFTEFRASVMSRGGAGLETLVKLPGDVLALAVLAGSKVRYQGQDAVILTIRLKDEMVSESVQLKQALAEEARNAEILRQQFACAAHEFRTPLAIIDSTAQRIERAGSPLSIEAQRQKAQKIRKNVKRVLQLLEFSADAAPGRDNVLGYEPALCDLNPPLQSVVQAMEDSFPTLTVDCQLGRLPPIWMDETLIEQVFSNLFENSIKYSDGAPQVEICSYVSASHIEITFRDWGIGIPAADAAEIFTPEHRAGNVGARPGSGLGLYIVARIMALHGGQIDLVPIPGPGAKFRLTFPRDFSGGNPSSISTP